MNIETYRYDIFVLTAANLELAAQQLPSVATSFHRIFVNSFPKGSVGLSLMNLNLVKPFGLLV